MTLAELIFTLPPGHRVVQEYNAMVDEVGRQKAEILKLKEIIEEAGGALEYYADRNVYAPRRGGADTFTNIRNDLTIMPDKTGYAGRRAREALAKLRDMTGPMNA